MNPLRVDSGDPLASAFLPAVQEISATGEFVYAFLQLCARRPGLERLCKLLKPTVARVSISKRTAAA